MKLPISELSKTFIKCSKCFDQTEGKQHLVECWPPRGWGGPEDIKEPRLMFVSLNPGHPFPSELEILRKYFPNGLQSRESVTEESARAIADFCWDSYCNPKANRDYLFHKRSVAYAKLALWLLNADPDKWQQHCWFTDAVKCSTWEETKANIPNDIYKSCQPHLKQEIETIQPNAIIALGGMAYRKTLETIKNINGTTKKVPVAKFLHPSRWHKLYYDDPSKEQSNKQLPDFLKFAQALEDNKIRLDDFKQFRKKIQDALTNSKTK